MMNKTWRIPSYLDVSCSGCRPNSLHCHLNKNNSNRDSACILNQSWSPVTTMLMNVGGGPSRAKQSREDTWLRHSTLLCRHQPRRTVIYHEADRFWRYLPDDEDGDGPRNAGLLATQPSDGDAKRRQFYRTPSPWKLSVMDIKLGCDGSICVLF